MLASLLEAEKYVTSCKPCFIIDIKLKSFDYLYVQNNMALVKQFKQQITQTLKTLPHPPLITSFLSYDHFLCLFQAASKQSLMKHIANLDDAIYLISDQITGQHVFLGIGISEYQPDDDLYLCIQKAKLARTLSKDAQKFHTHIEWYENNFLHELQKKHQLAQLIYRTIGQKSFQMVIQPKITCAQEHVCGGEALIRLPYLEGMNVDTFHMITLAEDNGLIEDLDLSMFEKVCKYQLETIRRKEPLLPISVNISRIHFQTPNFFQAYLRIYQQYHLPDHCIELEITERAQDQFSMPQISAFLQQAHHAGFLVSLDDFGSGQSSLGMLSTMQIDSIKLDRSFFLHDTKESKIIISSILQLAHSLSITTIAEGIETEAQVHFLKDRQCTAIQGFYYAPPLQEEAFRSYAKQFFH